MSTAYGCLLFWPILIVSGAFEQTRGKKSRGGWREGSWEVGGKGVRVFLTRGIGGGGGEGGRGAGHFQYVRGNYKSLTGTDLTVVASHPFISSAW